MKSHNKIKIVLALAVGLVAGTVQAQKPVVKVSATAQSAKLVYQSKKSGKVAVKVTDEQGELLSRSLVDSEKGFLRPYSFKNLPPGLYYFEVTDSEGTYKRSVKIGEPAASRVPVVALERLGEGQALHLTVKRREQSPVRVEIFDAHGLELHEELISDHTSFDRVYQMTKLQGQEVLVRVSDKTGVLRAERFLF